LINIHKPRFFYGWYMVMACWVMLFLQCATAMAIFFKPMLEEFGWDRATLSSVQSISLLLFAVLSPFLGRLLDRVGPRFVILAGSILQVLSAVLNGLATTLWHLYVARLFYSINTSPGSQVLINRWFNKLRGTALGILSSGMPIGTLLLTPVSQFLILSWGWRNTLFFWACVLLLVSIPLVLIIRNSPGQKGLKPDGQTIGHDNSIQDESNPAQRKPVAAEGYTLKKALNTRAYWLLGISHFICGLGCGFIMTHIVIFATDMGFSDMVGASLLSIKGGFNLLGVLSLGFLSDRIMRKNVLALTFGVRSFSFLIMIVFILTGGSSLPLLFLAVALFGIGWFTTAPLTAGMVADLYGNLRQGTILGLMTSFHMLGMAVGAYSGGAIFDRTGGYYPFFLVQFPLELIAAVCVLCIKQKKAY
jgi:MFS family permease